jgi:hypothetical protein
LSDGRADGLTSVVRPIILYFGYEFWASYQVSRSDIRSRLNVEYR